MAVRPALNLRIADHLLECRLLSDVDHRRAVEYARERNMRIEEALLELDIISEQDLLGAVSKLHETQFVSTERMSRAKVDRNALRLMPKKVAQLYGVYPLLYEPNANRLVVATADPDNLAALDEIRAASRVREVRPLVARPGAVAAAIARGYDDETYAFTDLLRSGLAGFGELELGDPFQRTDTHQIPPQAARPAPAAEPPARQPPRAPPPPRGRAAEPAAREPRSPYGDAPARPPPREPRHRSDDRPAARYTTGRHDDDPYRASPLPDPYRGAVQAEAYDESGPEPAYRDVAPAPAHREARRPLREERPERGEPIHAGGQPAYRGAARAERAPEDLRGGRGGARPAGPYADPSGLRGARGPEALDDVDDGDWGASAAAAVAGLDDPFDASSAAKARAAVPSREGRWQTPDDALVGAPAARAAVPPRAAARPERPVAEPLPPVEPPEAEGAADLAEPAGGAALGRVALKSRVGRAADLQRPAGEGSQGTELPLVGSSGAAFEAPPAVAKHDPRAEPGSIRPRPAEPGTEEPPGEPKSTAHRSLPPPPSRLQFGPHARRASERPPPLSTSAAPAQVVEVLRVLVGLLDNEREELRGHCSLVARLAQDAAERIRLTEEQSHALVVASYLHDVGKRPTTTATRGNEPPVATTLHLTALNVAQFPPHREQAEKLRELPEQLMAGAGLPAPAFAALGALYEQFGGRGIPGDRSGSDIPIEARILAVAESYADLTQNRRNPFGQAMSPEEAMAELRRHAGTVFDPNIVDVFEHALGGEKILGQLLDDRHRVLIVDPDPEQTLVLQLRLSDQGFDVHLARTTKEARAALAANKFALVVSEVDVEERDAGLFLREEVAKREDAHRISWVFLSGRSSHRTAKRAFDLGIDDFIAKPTSGDIVVAKLLQILERQADKPRPAKAEASRGVSGSLSDMGVTDLVQVLWHGRRTCALHIETDETKGELHFQEGQMVHAIWGDATGETAFYRLLAYSENGRFRVDPSFVPSGEPTIRGSPEGMLLEAMRLIDEKCVP